MTCQKGVLYFQQLFLLLIHCVYVAWSTDITSTTSRPQKNYFQCRYHLELCDLRFKSEGNTRYVLSRYLMCVDDVPNTGDPLCENMKKNQTDTLLTELRQLNYRYDVSSSLHHKFDSVEFYLPFLPLISLLL